MNGRIFNIQRFSIHDGPGTRTTVFFKGCNLRCVWCHNPESIPFSHSLEFYPEKCIGCGACFASCTHGAQVINEDGVHIIERDKCASCLACAENCFADALCGIGKETDSEYVLRQILTDVPYYGEDGGVTFSGGECMIQIDFLAELCEKCHANGINVAVDTAGNVPWRYFERILPYTDYFLYDMKAASPELHRELTGSENTLILENLRRLAESGAKLIVRIPYIPGKNSPEIERMADLLTEIDPILIEVLPYHRLGESKYSALGLDDAMTEISPPSDEELDGVIKLLHSKNLNARRT